MSATRIIDSREIPAGTKQRWNFTAARMTVNSIEVPVTVINGVKEGPTVVITAGVHPNEMIGQAATVQLSRELEPEEIAGTLIMVHIENPMGLQFKYANRSPLDNVNMNSVFPTGLEKASKARMNHSPSQPASRMIFFMSSTWRRTSSASSEKPVC